MKIVMMTIIVILYTLEDLKWDKVPLNPRETLPINELTGTQIVPI
jgi:hypothetical protein